MILFFMEFAWFVVLQRGDMARAERTDMTERFIRDCLIKPL